MRVGRDGGMNEPPPAGRSLQNVTSIKNGRRMLLWQVSKSKLLVSLSRVFPGENECVV